MPSEMERRQRDYIGGYYEMPIFSRAKRLISRNRGERIYMIDFRGIEEPDQSEPRPYVRAWWSRCENRWGSIRKLKNLVDEYYKSLWGTLRNKRGEPVFDERGNPVQVIQYPATLAGLCNHIGISIQMFDAWKTGFYDDESIPPDQENYSDVLLSAEQRLMEYIETQLYDKNASLGAQFILKHRFFWRTVTDDENVKTQRFNRYIKQAEFELRKQMSEEGGDTADFEIKIVRKADNGKKKKKADR